MPPIWFLRRDCGVETVSLSAIPYEGPYPCARSSLFGETGGFSGAKGLFARREDFGGVYRPRGVLRRGERQRFSAFSVFATRRWCFRLIASISAFSYL